MKNRNSTAEKTQTRTEMTKFCLRLLKAKTK